MSVLKMLVLIKNIISIAILYKKNVKYNINSKNIIILYLIYNINIFKIFYYKIFI